MYNVLYLLIVVFLSLSACTSTPPTEEEQAEITANEPRKRVVISTQYGDMTIELFNQTPKHRDNFIKLAKAGFYDSLLIHRVQPNFMIQGGDPSFRGDVPPEIRLGNDTTKNRIPAEINPDFILRQGALCAYHGGGKDKSSHYSQFMIIHGQPLKAYQIQELSIESKIDYTAEQIHLYELYGGSPQYEGDYTIFGQVVDGVHVLNKIVAVRTHRSVNPTLPDRPLEDIRMTVKVIE